MFKKKLLSISSIILVLVLLGGAAQAAVVKDQPSDWARTAADAMYAAEVMNGTSTTELVFSPQEAYIRERAVITVLNLWNYTHPTTNPSTPGHAYDMSDPNVIKYPIYATAKSANDLKL